MNRIIDFIYLSALAACVLIVGVSKDINTARTASIIGIVLWFIYIGIKANEKN